MDFKPHQLNINGQLIPLDKPIVMAIINFTPDSFYKSSQITSIESLLENVDKAIRDGATIIDVGAYSSRPSAEPLAVEDEKRRLEIALGAIRKQFPNIIISLDTFRADVAKWAADEYGIEIINDISGGDMDENMFETVAKLQVPYIMMHMRGTPQTMQQLTDYEHLISDIFRSFERKTAKLIDLGVKDIVIDPGFGFAKTLDQNYELLANLSLYKELGCPVLVGMSRKSMLYNLLEISSEEALNATSVVNTLALLGGANILRVHDVKEAVETIKLYEQYQKYR